MREAKKIRLRHGYLGPLTKAQIARREGISEHVVARFWAAEKAAGGLPAVRPHFVERSAPLVEQVIEDVIEVEAEAEVDLDDDTATPAGAIGPPIYAPNPRFEAASNALLGALRGHHAALDRAGVQDAPAAWLRAPIEIIRFSAGVEEINRHLPTRDKLLAQCRAADLGHRAHA